MGKKDKKKGKGAEKTALKTEKKALNRIKKDLAAIGEDEMEKLISASSAARPQTISLEACAQPSPRSSFTLCPHPEKEELILFGGEYYNGSQTAMFDEVYFYNIKKARWNILQCPVSPKPRCSHQAVTVPQKGGQMWVFGGEFASPTRETFYHFRDLWVLNLATMTWEEVKRSGGPSARSGHRMVLSRKQFIVFGGFLEVNAGSDYKYYNDIFAFNLETYTWSKIDATGRIPTPRSGFLMVPLMDGRVFVYGGYCREKAKKRDADTAVCHTDMYYLQVDERTEVPKWKWVQVKPSGSPPSVRSGMGVCVAPNNNAFAFGGVRDEDKELFLESVFHNDLYHVELDRGRWRPLVLQKRAVAERRKRRRAKDGDEEFVDEEDIAEELERTTLTPQEEVKTFEDSIFTVRVGPSSSSSTQQQDPTASGACAALETVATDAGMPKPRMQAGMVVKNGILYLYGGVFEEDERQYTLSDFYALDIHKMDEWQTLIPYTDNKADWVESSDNESSGMDTDECDDSDEDEDGDMDEEMETE